MLEVRHLTKEFVSKKKHLMAVDDLSFTIQKGEVLGIVGASGCGKSTLARLLMRLFPPTSGQIFLNQEEITHSRAKSLCLKMQMIFQDPFASLNPRMTVGDLIQEPLLIHHLPDWVDQLLDLVQLPKDSKRRFPHEFSGGQRQRIAMARALALKPEILICDEPISALDVSTQKQIIDLLLSLKKEFDLTYLFIAHDLAVVNRVSDRIAVMNQGKIVEIGRPVELFKNPSHIITQQLIEAIPRFKRSIF